LFLLAALARLAVQCLYFIFGVLAPWRFNACILFLASWRLGGSIIILVFLGAFAAD
jgi:hypothetical protein